MAQQIPLTEAFWNQLKSSPEYTLRNYEGSYWAVQNPTAAASDVVYNGRVLFSFTAPDDWVVVKANFRNMPQFKIVSDVEWRQLAGITGLPTPRPVSASLPIITDISKTPTSAIKAAAQKEPAKKDKKKSKMKDKERNGASVAAIVFTFLFAPLGFILGLVGLSKSKKLARGKGRGLSLTAMLLSLVVMAGAGVGGYLYKDEILDIVDEYFPGVITPAEPTPPVETNDNRVITAVELAAKAEVSFTEDLGFEFYFECGHEDIELSEGAKFECIIIDIAEMKERFISELTVSNLTKTGFNLTFANTPVSDLTFGLDPDSDEEL